MLWKHRAASAMIVSAHLWILLELSLHQAIDSGVKTNSRIRNSLSSLQLPYRVEQY